MVRPTLSTLTVWQHQTSNFSPTPLGHLATEHTSRATGSITHGNPTNRTIPSSGIPSSGRSSLLSLRPPSHGDNSGQSSASGSFVTTSRSSWHGSTSLTGTLPYLTYSATSFCMLPNTTTPSHSSTCPAASTVWPMPCHVVNSPVSLVLLPWPPNKSRPSSLGSSPPFNDAAPLSIAQCICYLHHGHLSCWHPEVCSILPEVQGSSPSRQQANGGVFCHSTQPLPRPRYHRGLPGSRGLPASAAALSPEVVAFYTSGTSSTKPLPIQCIQYPQLLHRRCYYRRSSGCVYSNH